MHPAAYEWVKRWATKEPVTVLDIGGRNINGTVRDLFPNATRYVAVDLYPGEGVDVVGDVCGWETGETFDVVVCCEVLEHAANWREICATAYDRCAVTGVFIMTCAAPSRAPHSGVDGGWKLHEGEHYAGVSAEDVEKLLWSQDWCAICVDVQGDDTRALAIKG